MYSIRILIAEDEDPLRKMTAKYLEREGYQVYQASNGAEAKSLLENKCFDLVILDIMMPEINGWTLCEYIKSTSDIPVIFLTARTQEEDKITGFNLGVDQYVEKPYSNKELVARVKSILRKRKLDISDKNIVIGDLYIDKNAREIKVCNKEISLTSKEYDMLLYLIDNKNIVLSRALLIDRVWNYEDFLDERAVDTVIKRIRSKLGIMGNCIKTIRGIGYKFEV